MKNTADIERQFEANQKDLTLDNLTVWWIGSMVILTLNGRGMTTLTADANIVLKVKRWCVKNHYRCERVKEGKIWL